MSDAIATFAGVDGSLRGILVLELCGDEPSGTYGTQILADLGATVIKIERLPQDDPKPTPDRPMARCARTLPMSSGSTATSAASAST